MKICKKGGYPTGSLYFLLYYQLATGPSHLGSVPAA